MFKRVDNRVCLSNWYQKHEIFLVTQLTMLHSLQSLSNREHSFLGCCNFSLLEKKIFSEIIVLKMVFNGQVNTVIWQIVEFNCFCFKDIRNCKNLKPFRKFLMVYFSILYICYQEA